jgi:hypothetical protein
MNNLDPYEFYFELPIYTPVVIDESIQSDFLILIKYTKTIDAYSPTLKENTTYSVSPCQGRSWDTFYNYGGMSYSMLTCVRTKESYYVFYYYDIQEKIFQKIGQYPSIADFHISQIKKYDKVLSKEKLKEFTRAIGLAANGVGIGSFIYLRRIFEDLIEEAHLKAQISTNWDEVEYSKQRISERIELLNSYLPAFLIENKSLYGILSSGVHNLKEEECLAYFDTVKVGIELILDEKVEQYHKIKKLEEAKKKISDLTGKIKK